MTRPLMTSLTRISDLPFREFETAALPRADWETGDYVVGEVVSDGWPSARLELSTGREMSPAVGDEAVGALGTRAATLEAVGDWRDIGEDGRMDALTAGGLFGRATSCSPSMGSLVGLRYRGHAVRDGVKLTMQDFVVPVVQPLAWDRRTVLIIGTSMSSGKTVAGRIITRLLKQLQYRVVGAKVTGAGRFRDILALQDAGADAVFDFVDAGLPSTVCPEEAFRAALQVLLQRVAAERPDVVVAEAGASPLEPYNGAAAIEFIRPAVRMTVLAACDPYAVVGVSESFGFRPDLVVGVATSTTAGCRIVEQLSGVPALNLLDPAARPQLLEMLQSRLVIVHGTGSGSFSGR